MRAKLLPVLVWLMWHKWCTPAWHTRLRKLHADMLDREMAARRARGQQEVTTGVTWMTPEELDEHGKRF